MTITSPVFKENEIIPTLYTCYGKNINPPFIFLDIPKNAKSLVFIIEDIDATPVPWIHWLLFDIPISIKKLEDDSIPSGSIQGICNGGTYGYEGPCPKYFKGTHHYYFRLYALTIKLNLPDTSDTKVVKKEMKNHILEDSYLIGLAKGTQQ